MATPVQVETKIFVAEHKARICMLWVCGLLGGPNAILGLLMLVKLLFIAAAMFGCLAVVMLFLAAHSLSVRVEIGPTEITYQSIIGRKVMKLHDVESAFPSSIRGVTFLMIKAGRRWIQCSTYTFSAQQLSEMQSVIQKSCRALSKDVATHRTMSDTDWMNFVMIYLLGIVITGAVIIIYGIHHLHSRGLR